MAEPLRHRQTKEADNRYVRPTATASHLDSTMTDKTHNEHKESAFGLIATSPHCRSYNPSRIATNRSGSVSGTLCSSAAISSAVFASGA
jgi:hypothetical protein